MKKICILDYGLGNTKSLYNSIKYLGYEVFFYSEKNIRSLKLTELMIYAKNFNYINPGTKEESWSTEEIYYAALHETLNSKYQIRASEIICGIFPPLKLLFKK